MFTTIAPAGDDYRWIGREFTPKPSCRPRIGIRDIPLDQVPRPFRVQKISGDWLWVGQAWVKKQDVVAVDGLIEEFDVAQNGEMLLLPVDVGGQSFKFVVSTTSERYTVDSLLYARCVFETGVRDRDKDGFPTNACHLHGLLGKTRIPIDGHATADDMSRHRALSGLDMFGTLGMHFFKNQIIRVDFENGKLAVLDSVPPDSGTEVQLSFDEKGAPTVMVELSPNVRTPFRVKLGHAKFVCGTLTSADYRQLQDANRLRIHEGVRVTNPPGSLDQLQLGPLIERDLMFSESDRNLLGQGFLSRFTVTFDFPGRRMFLKRRVQIPNQRNVGECGLEIIRISGKTYVDSVDETGPARSAGMQAGDVVLKVSGRDTSVVSMFELRRVLFERGNRVQLVVDRDGEILEFDIVVSE